LKAVPVAQCSAAKQLLTGEPRKLSYDRKKMVGTGG
jgi:hypothetical protein